MMKIETGVKAMGNVQSVTGNAVRFIAEDGNTMFEVVAGNDGKSITVRGVDCCVVAGVRHIDAIDVRPVTTNMVQVRTRRQDGE